MIIVCQKCSSRLQVDEAKTPPRPFNIRCPKCNSSVDSNSVSPALEQIGTVVGVSAATVNLRFDQPTPAPLFGFEQKNTGTDTAISATERLAELLSGMINQSTAQNRRLPAARPSWDLRKVLVCVPEDCRELIARSLAEKGYKVFLAHDTRQAVDRMRQNQLDVVLLDPRFDPVEQGSVFVTREVTILRPAQRRRLFFVLLSPSLCTMDAHAAFLNNVNAIININELGELPNLLEHGVREYNELYKEFNTSLGIPAL